MPGLSTEFRAWLSALAASAPVDPLRDEETWLATPAGWIRAPHPDGDWRDALLGEVPYRAISVARAGERRSADVARQVLAWLAAVGEGE